MYFTIGSILIISFLILLVKVYFDRRKEYAKMLEKLRLDCLQFNVNQSKKGLTSHNGEYVDIFDLAFFPILFGKTKIILSFWKPVELNAWIKPAILKRLYP